MKEIKTIFLFGNGNVAVYDDKEEQVSKLQENVIIKVFKEAKKLGYKIKDDVEIFLPYGEKASKTKGYDNITIGE